MGNNLSECLVLGKIRSAVGSAQLLMSQKFQQFYWLCQQNLVSHFAQLFLKSLSLFICNIPQNVTLFYNFIFFTSRTTVVHPSSSILKCYFHVPH